MNVERFGRAPHFFHLLLLCFLPSAADAQWLTGGPSPLPVRAPQAAYTVVDAFPGMPFPLATDAPVTLATPPGGTNELFVGGLFGQVYVITNLTAPTKTLFLDISAKTFAPGATLSESGLVGLAFHPRYAQNRYFYVFYTRTNLVEGKTYDTLSRFETDPENPWRALPDSEHILISQWDRHDVHQAGDLHFGADGYLYVSLGDEGTPNDFFKNSQRIDQNFFSGILRIDVDSLPGNLPPNPHPSVVGEYRVPADNPFVGATSFNGIPVPPESVRTEFYAVGLRNPHRFSIDSATGEIYSGDVGASRLEEVNRIVKGGNYGWAYLEGNLRFPDAAIGAPPPGFTSIPPIYSYAHTGDDPNFTGHAIIGGFVYRGKAHPELIGKYIFGDVFSCHVWAMTLNPSGPPTVTRIATGNRGMSSFAIHPGTGEILLCELFGGRISKLQRTSVEGDSTLPPTLGESRVFSDLETLTPAAGAVPYDVMSTFWSDNAIKRRWFFMQNATDRIHRESDGQWSYPTGTVFVKHFDFEFEVGNPASRRRLETRILMKTEDATYGITYKWRPDGLEADLVPDSGLDESLQINDGGIVRTQVWHYPGRSECLTCHNSGARHVLGFNALQLNRDVPSGDGTPVNQLALLSRLGVFDNPVTSPESLPHLSAITDTAASVESRFKTYLEVNCAYCHLPGGLGRGVWDARFTTPLDESGIINGSVIDDLGVPGARVIRPGDPTASVMWKRVAEMGADHMPPLGTSVLNTTGIALLEQFIQGYVTASADRTVWQVGQDSPPGTRATLTFAEFSLPNNRNDAPPGAVTRELGDADYDPDSNPKADDDYYFKGTYPAGFNGLTGERVVSADEPSWAWERAHTLGDPVNRIHFVLTPDQVAEGARFRLRFEMSAGGYAVDNVPRSGFSAHDFVVRFRNGDGVETTLYSQTLTRPTDTTVDFLGTTVHATAGANTIEFTRTGPAAPSTSYWIEYDVVRLEQLVHANSAPEFSEADPQTIPELLPWTWNVTATDVDAEDELTYSLVSGPAGMTLTPAGELSWTPTEAQGPSTNLVTVRVMDNGFPRLSAVQQVVVIVLEVPDPVSGPRTTWQIGDDAPPGSKPPTTVAEFSMQNARRDAPPGEVTRLPDDPEFLGEANPGPDDDFYFAGFYPAGFNGLEVDRIVPVDEPASAWERAHTLGDPVNRFHFVLSPVQVAEGSRFRLRFELPTGGSSEPGSGFGAHDFEVRFLNGAGAATTLFSQHLTQPTDATVEFLATDVAATPGPNTIELVRTGPSADETSYWLEYDVVRLEALGGAANTAPSFVAPGTQTIPELTPWSMPVPAHDADVPANILTYKLLGGPEGMGIGKYDGLLSWTPGETQGPSTNLITVQVTDNGTPPLSETVQFTVVVEELEDVAGAPRNVWKIGEDAPVGATLRSNYSEFSPPNYRNDPRPGHVTRLPDDPLYVAESNPKADDDFYFKGDYPAGFNGLSEALPVPNDEPASAWEYDHTRGDATNRFHFILSPEQVAPGARFRISMEFPTGGRRIGNKIAPGFGTHDMVVRFRNEAGRETVLQSVRLTQGSRLWTDFTAADVGANVGPNTIDIVRVGPRVEGEQPWITYDFVRLESLVTPSPGEVASVEPTTEAPRVAAFSPAPRAVRAPALKPGSITAAGGEYLTLTYARPSGVKHQVEVSEDLLTWTPATVVKIAETQVDGKWMVTVRDTVPVGEGRHRFLRLRVSATGSQVAE
ncbi:MAG: PQQ-dependent sugar dehydrogenase [Verrucomicrobiales bacterium]|nr:PQQ-dependent sugar dehydrogenase [Verrucomicrobiales bacterium]